MTPKQTIIFNTGATYVRTVIGVFLALFSSRWLLQELGIVDYGLYSLVGSLIILFSFFNTVIANGDARFFAIAIGKNDSEYKKRLFKATLTLHSFLPPILAIIGWAIGEMAIRYFLNIPEERMDAMLVILRLAIITSVFTMFNVPFKALFIAHQNIAVFSFIELAFNFFSFFAAFSLIYYDGGDKLIYYVSLVSIIQLASYVVYIIISIRKYPAFTKIAGVKLNKDNLYEILRFSFWNCLGDIGHLIRTQGVAIVVNLLFGAAGNSALGIANNVSMQANGLANSFMSSTSPEIYRRIGADEMLSGIALSRLVSKFGVLLILILAIPLITFMDEILKIWLVDVPPYTAELCICFMVMYIIERFTMGQIIMLQAVNRIKECQISVLFCYSLSVVFPYLGLCRFFNITGVGLSCIISMILSRMFVFCIYYRFFSVIEKDKTPMLSFIFSSSVLFVAMIFLSKLCVPKDASLLLIVLYSIVIILITIILYFYWVLSAREKKSLIDAIQKRIK